MATFRTKIGTLLVAASCVTAAAIVETPAASASTPAAVTSQPTEAMERDINAYAQTYSVSAQEAFRRLQIQEAAGALNARLSENEAPTFAGLYIEHTPQIRVVVRLTRNAEQTLARYIGGGILMGVAQAQAAETPLAQLISEQTAAYDRVRASGIPVSGSIDLKENRVEIYVKAEDFSRAVGAMARVPGTKPDTDRVEVVTVPELPKEEANVYGGLEIVGGGALSTTGFTVRRNSDGKMGV